MARLESLQEEQSVQCAAARQPGPPLQWPQSAMPSQQPSKRHPLHEDLLAWASTTLIVSLGVQLLEGAGLITGGLAGLALLLAQLTPFGFGPIFAVLNLPFYLLALRELGWRFTLNTLLCVGSLALLSESMPDLVGFDRLDPAFAAVAGGMLIGVGMLIAFRHQASLGGIGILAFYLQNHLGWRAGYVQMAVDVGVLLLGLLLLPMDALGMSILGAIVLNGVIAVNHRPGRYNIG